LTVACDEGAGAQLLPQGVVAYLFRGISTREQQTSPTLDPYTVPVLVHVRAHRSTRPVVLWWRETGSLCLSSLDVWVMYSWRSGAAYSPKATQHATWRQCLSCNRVDGADGALTPTCNRPSLTPRRSRWRDKSASYMTTIAVRQCACQETEQGDVQRGITATLDTALHRALSPAINPGDGSASYPQQLHRWDLEHMPA
jgi:hypothetical protein